MNLFRSGFARHASVMIMFAIVASCCGPLAMGQGRNDIIAQTGQAAPNGNGTLSFFVGSPALNDSGAVAFSAALNGTSGGLADNFGIFRGTGGSLTQIARKGQLTPTGIGSLSDLYAPQLNDSGAVAFFSTLTGTSGSSGIFRGNGGSLTQIVREGQLAPNGNGTLSSFSSHVLNNSGAASFHATLIGTSGGSTDNSGIFLGGVSITQIARKGQLAPNGNGTLSGFVFSGLNDLGEVAFMASLTGTSGGLLDNEGIYRGNGGSLTQIARAGQLAPDGNGTLSVLTGLPSMNDSGAVAFSAFLTGTSGGGADHRGIFRGTGGSLTQIARTGQLAPDGNGTLNNLASSGLNDSGALAFSAALTGTIGGSADDDGIYVADGIDTLQVVREGDSMSGSTVVGVSLASGPINNLGQVAYRATLANGIDTIRRWTPDLHWRHTSSSAWDTNGHWTLGLTPGNPHDVFIDPAASLTVTGPAASTTVRSLQIGGGTGQATLDLRNGATLTSTNGVMIASTGTLTGDGSIAGNVVNNGNILADNVTVVGTLTNQSVIEGSGRVHANIVNGPSGEIRALSGNTMRLTGASFSNAGLVEVHGGELRVTSNLQNNSGSGLISMRNGSLIATAGINNAGSVAFSQASSTLRGDLNNVGIIQVSGGANATFFDDVVQNGTMQVASVGNTNSSAVILGAFTGSGGFVGGGDVFALGDLRPGNSPSVVTYGGNLFMGTSTHTFIEIAGLALGEFDKMIVTGNLNLAGSLSVSLLDGFMLGAGQQYLIGEVGGMLSGQFNGLGEGSLVGVFSGYQTFISYTAGDGNDIALITAIPEPGTPVLFALLGLLMTSRRRKYDV